MTDHISSSYEINLQTEITYLKGVGPVRAEALQDIEFLRLGIYFTISTTVF